MWEKKTEARDLWPDSRTASNDQQERGLRHGDQASHRRSLGECQTMQFPIVRSTERLVVAQDQAIQSESRCESYALRMYHVNHGHSRFWKFACHTPEANIAHHWRLAQGSYRVQALIVWRDAREDRFRKHQNDQTEASTWVRRRPRSVRRLKALKANHVLAAGDARTHPRRSNGDVLEELPPEKPRGLRGDPAQWQRAEIGRIRRYFQV